VQSVIREAFKAYVGGRDSDFRDRGREHMTEWAGTFSPLLLRLLHDFPDPQRFNQWSRSEEKNFQFPTGRGVPDL
jgi:hypothetical protein